LEYRILGPLEIVDDVGALLLGGRKQRAVLAVLLLHANQVVSTDKLIDDVWGEDAPPSAPSALQVYIAQLRKALGRTNRGAEAIRTRSPGYELVVAEDELDADRFARICKKGRASLAGGDPAGASEQLQEALACWRGQPLAEFTYETFAQSEIERLEEAKIAAIEDRVEADLALGRHLDLVGELDSLVGVFPLRERLRGHLMLALYRSGRQAEALQVFRDARDALAEQLGLDPGPELQELERAILNHEDALALRSPTKDAASVIRKRTSPRERSILVAPRDPSQMRSVASIAGSLARIGGDHDVILVRLAGPWEGTAGEPVELADAHRSLETVRTELNDRGTPTRIISFTSVDPAGDLARLVREHPVDLLLIQADVGSISAPTEIGEALESVGCDVAIVVGSNSAGWPPDGDPPVVSPFGGAEHDWPALEFAAWIASAEGLPFRLLGSTADLKRGQRDASRLLARASLIVQNMTGAVAQPVLVDPGRGILGDVRAAAAVVMGLPDDWVSQGLGELRAEVCEAAAGPVILTRRGSRTRSGAPSTEGTRFGWSRARSGPDAGERHRPLAGAKARGSHA
jgi:DNA-binding SARP family transcriptional activator